MNVKIQGPLLCTKESRNSVPESVYQMYMRDLLATVLHERPDKFVKDTQLARAKPLCRIKLNRLLLAERHCSEICSSCCCLHPCFP